MDNKKKYIHYCWFGDKPLPKLAKKCIDSWKKYLPDYEIIKWNEDNVNLEECPFIKEAYENKKWAFVADYARTKALYEMGGIYFDTDMEVTKNIDELIKKGPFLGVEDTGKIACGVWYEDKPHSYLSTQLLKKYKSFENFDVNNMGSFSIPILITDILEECGFEYNSKVVQKLDHNIYIYPRDYFYPYSYNRENNIFTDNTCMIHYYDASWIPMKDKIENNMVRKFGRSKTFKILSFYRRTKSYIRKAGKVVLFPVVIYRNKKQKQALITDSYLKRIEETVNNIKKINKKDYIVLHNKEFIGVTSSTYELFDNCIDCGEIYQKKDAKKIAQAIIDQKIKQVVFSSLSIGQKDIIKEIKSKDNTIKIKAYWHGSHSQILDGYGWNRFQEILQLHRKGKIDAIGTCKKSLYNFYKDQGLNVYFISNVVKLPFDVKKTTKGKQVRIGLYAANCTNWRKNMFAQMAAVSKIPNAILDMVPLSDTAKEFAETLDLKIDGEEKSLPREELIKRMANNTVNLYVTFSECSPMLPLESFEVGVPCITGNNFHYFENSELEKYIVVDNEDDINSIYEKIDKAMKNNDKVLKLYQQFKKENEASSKEQVKTFLEG